MIISELIKELEKNLDTVGDIECVLIKKQPLENSDSIIPVDECYTIEKNKESVLLITY